ncbi:MAG: glucosamine-6-phosphate deaminase [Planctomycetota bacterium]|nr:glucosamine-6-phosphate deaminase [Planctomycetota bacterium]
MRVLICDNEDQAARMAADEILAALKEKPDLVLGLATGSTPIRIYSLLIQAHQGGQSFEAVRTFNLDEYLNLPGDHPQSYRHFMHEKLFGSIDIKESNVHFPPTEGSNLLARCADFEQAIRDAGGIDIQLLGIGRNGHIGFNEPTSSLASRTRLKTLTDKTLRDNARFYGPDEEQPQIAATMGIGTIMEARKILLQSFGAAKADAVHAAVEGPISSFWPASILQHHPDTSFYLDQASSQKLTMRDYYRRVQIAEQDVEPGL